MIRKWVVYTAIGGGAAGNLLLFAARIVLGIAWVWLWRHLDVPWEVGNDVFWYLWPDDDTNSLSAGVALVLCGLYIWGVSRFIDWAESPDD